MKKLNQVRRQFACNKSVQENERENTYTSVVMLCSEAKTIFLDC